MEDFTALQRTMEAALEHELGTNFSSEFEEMFLDIEELDIKNTLECGNRDGLVKALQTAINTTIKSLNLMTTTVENLGRQMSAEEEWFVVQTMMTLKRLLGFYTRALTASGAYEEITSGAGLPTN
jgi:hypothetical protein